MRLAVVLAVILAAPPVQAATYYINASTGDDSRNSTQAQNPATPWLTIKKACDLTLAAGDEIRVQGGAAPRGLVYHEQGTCTLDQNGTSGNRIKLLADGGVVTMRGLRTLNEAGFSLSMGQSATYELSLTTFTPFQVVATSLSAWVPIQVDDTNGASASIDQPVPLFNVSSCSAASVEAVYGSWCYDSMAQILYVHMYDDGDPSSGDYALEAGAVNDGRLHLDADNLSVEGVNGGSWRFEWPSANSNKIAALATADNWYIADVQFIGAPPSIAGTNGLMEDFEAAYQWGRDPGDPTGANAWHFTATGDAMASSSGTGNTFRRGSIHTSYNGINVNGTNETWEEFIIWGAPNHGFSIANSVNVTIRNCVVVNSQESVFKADTSGPATIENCVFWRNYTSTVPANSSFRNIVIRSIAFNNATPSGFSSDYNFFVRDAGLDVYINYGGASGDYDTIMEIVSANGQESHSQRHDGDLDDFSSWFTGVTTETAVYQLTDFCPAMGSPLLGAGEDGFNVGLSASVCGGEDPEPEPEPEPGPSGSSTNGGGGRHRLRR